MSPLIQFTTRVSSSWPCQVTFHHRVASVNCCIVLKAPITRRYTQYTLFIFLYYIIRADLETSIDVQLQLLFFSSPSPNILPLSFFSPYCLPSFSLLSRPSKSCHINSALKSLHWLEIKQHIRFFLSHTNSSSPLNLHVSIILSLFSPIAALGF